MKYFFLFIILTCVTSFRSFSQTGCTDPAASNYSATATINDGSCTYTPTTQPFNLMVNTINVGSNSGIEWMNGSVYTFGDSGNPPAFYKIDTTTGNISQNISVTNFGNQDWEDITADTGFVYIGDFGNNNGNRTDLKILKISKSQFINNPSSVVSVTAQAINFSYSDQTSFASNSNTNFDCEAMISIRDSLYIFTKDRGDLMTRVYKLSKTPGTYNVNPFLNFNTNGKITGADYNPINNEVILIGYKSGNLNSFIWYLSDFQGINFFSGNKRRVELGNASYAWQTEGIAFYNETSTHRIFISCEVNGITAGIYYSDINKIVGIKELPKKNNEIKIYPNPGFGIFKIECTEVISEIEILSMDGKIIYSKKIEQNNTTINSEEFTNSAGCYLLKANIDGCMFCKKLFVGSR
jgi:hypothetical protein